jgi:hypothetical protein
MFNRRRLVSESESKGSTNKSGRSLWRKKFHFGKLSELISAKLPKYKPAPSGSQVHGYFPPTGTS